MEPAKKSLIGLNLIGDLGKITELFNELKEKLKKLEEANKAAQKVLSELNAITSRTTDGVTKTLTSINPYHSVYYTTLKKIQVVVRGKTVHCFEVSNTIELNMLPSGALGFNQQYKVFIYYICVNNIHDETAKKIFFVIKQDEVYNRIEICETNCTLPECTQIHINQKLIELNLGNEVFGFDEIMQNALTAPVCTDEYLSKKIDLRLIHITQAALYTIQSIVCFSPPYVDKG